MDEMSDAASATKGVVLGYEREWILRAENEVRVIGDVAYSEVSVTECQGRQIGDKLTFYPRFATLLRGGPLPITATFTEVRHGGSADA
jgi:hypothetical protein